MVGGFRTTLRSLSSFYPRGRSEEAEGSRRGKRKAGGKAPVRGGRAGGARGGGKVGVRSPSLVPALSSSSSEEEEETEEEERQGTEEEERQGTEEEEETPRTGMEEEADAVGSQLSAGEIWRHYPGLVVHGQVTEPANTWNDYIACPDARDLEGRIFNNKAERVVNELWDFFRCEPGYEDQADALICRGCRKLVKDMHYEARIQAIVDYNAQFLKVMIKKGHARTMNITREQYLQVPAWWLAQNLQCSERMVAKWVDPQWEEQRNACRERRLMMQGTPHHQGSLTLSKYASRWSDSHGGQACGQFKAWAMAHKGKATSDDNYNPEDPPEAYSNASIQHVRGTGGPWARAQLEQERIPVVVDVGKLRLPRFKMSFESKLTRVLKEMGVDAAFDPDRADLSDMAEDDGSACRW
ncbi:hypothetical protein PR202_gb16875 [Eleusine coracana subsp. coracana]|uniref:Serpin domain-containing protein n=1 Tax=Eleusine coracana subsp. coracana TaxID=191504 RepID=A0AAV5F226_ELECO|nr:hypothetical protein PR202_gb16875 [Eleusine coracana subsp. coracana]